MMATEKPVLEVHETSKQDTECIPIDALERMKNQVKLLNKGFTVYISDITASDETSDYVAITMTLLSEVNRMNVFGDVRLKIAKQALPRLKHHIDKLSR